MRRIWPRSVTFASRWTPLFRPASSWTLRTLHKPTVYIDLSGWSPKYFPATLIQTANTLLKHKVLFGSGYPLNTPDLWMADFEKIAIRDEVRPLMLRENAMKLFGLTA